MQAGGFENEKNERLNDDHIPLKKKKKKHKGGDLMTSSKPAQLQRKRQTEYETALTRY